MTAHSRGEPDSQSSAWGRRTAERFPEVGREIDCAWRFHKRGLDLDEWAGGRQRTNAERGHESDEPDRMPDRGRRAMGERRRESREAEHDGRGNDGADHRRPPDFLAFSISLPSRSSSSRVSLRSLWSSKATMVDSTELSKKVSTRCARASSRSRTGSAVATYTKRGPSHSCRTWPLSSSSRSMPRTAEYDGGSGSSASTSATLDRGRRTTISMICRSRRPRLASAFGIPL